MGAFLSVMLGGLHTKFSNSRNSSCGGKAKGLGLGFRVQGLGLRGSGFRVFGF